MDETSKTRLKQLIIGIFILNSSEPNVPFLQTTTCFPNFILPNPHEAPEPRRDPPKLSESEPCAWTAIDWNPRRSDVFFWRSVILQCWLFTQHMGVSKNNGTPKWMVYKGKPIKMGWFGGTPIFGNTHINITQQFYKVFGKCLKMWCFNLEDPLKGRSKRHSHLQYTESTKTSVERLSRRFFRWITCRHLNKHWLIPINRAFKCQHYH